MPGVIASTQVRSGPVSRAEAPASTFFVVGLTERGRTNTAVVVNSFPEYASEFGARVAYGSVHDAVRTFFEEGGTRAVICRDVGPAATVGNLTLADRAGIPLSTLRVDAKGAGAWSTGITVAVANGSITDTFRLTISYAATGLPAEVFDNLANPSAAVAAVNAQSKWVTVTDLGSATAAPGNNPAVLAATALSAGNDDRAAVTATTMLARLNALATAGFGAGSVAIPGQPGSTVGAGLIAHARDNNRIALIAGTPTASVADIQALAGTLRGADGSYAGLFYPYIQIPDDLGGTRNISPESYVAAVRARAHETEGAWRAPAGAISRSRFVRATVTPISNTEGTALNGQNVSVIRTIANTVQLYGWRSLSTDTANFELLTGRDFLNFLVVEGSKRLEQFVFRTIDVRGHLLGEMAAEMVGLVEPIRLNDGIYALVDANGEQLDSGYSVDVGPNVNTPTTLARNEAHVAVAVRIAPTGALIRLLITKAGLTATL